MKKFKVGFYYSNEQTSIYITDRTNDKVQYNEVKSKIKKDKQGNEYINFKGVFNKVKINA